MKQEQQVDAGSTAIQSGGDTLIQTGLSPDQMKQIIATVAAQVPAYAAIAREIVGERLIEFEKRIIEKFSSDTTTKSAAFKDPDFQYLLGRAQHAYARSGDGDIGTTLADLIAERSKSSDRDRLALTLNEAVEVASRLTVNEFAELAFCYLFSRTRAHSRTVPSFITMLNDRINPFIDDISRSDASYSYLEAQRCASVGVLVTNFRDLLINNYTGLLFNGFSLDELTAVSPQIDQSNSQLVIPNVHYRNLFQLNSMSKDVWDEVTANENVETSARDAAWNFAQTKIMTEDEIIDTFTPTVPRIKEAFDLWNKTPINSLQLTSVGIAIGHSYATKSGFSANLSEWIN